MKRAAAAVRRHTHIDRVGAGDGNRQRVVEPLAGLDPADVVAPAAVGGRLDVHVVAPVHAAGVAGRGVVVADVLAAAVVVLELFGERRRGRRRRRRGRCHRGVQGREVDADVGAVGRGLRGQARRHQPVISRRNVHEISHPLRHRREVVARGVQLRLAAAEPVRADVGVWRVEIQADAAFAVLVTVDRVRVVAEQVVREHEARDLDAAQGVAAVDEHGAAAVAVDRVVIDRDRLGSAANHREARRRRIRRRAPRRVDVVRQVVADDDAGGLLARREVVVAGDVEDRRDVADDVVLDRDVLDDGPGRSAALIARRHQNRIALLASRPVVFDRVPLEEHVLRVLELDEVLDGPRRRPPGDRFRDVVAAQRDVRGHQVRDGGIAAAEQHVLSCRLEVVVLDQIRAGTVPAGDRLRVLVDAVNLGEVRVQDLRVAAVERERSTLAPGGLTVEVAAVHDEVVRNRSERGLRRVGGAELHEISAGVRHGRREFQEQQPPVSRGADGPQRRAVLIRLDLGEERRGGRCDPRAGRRQRAVGRGRTNRDGRSAALRGQLVVAGEGRPCLQHDGVARLGGVERRLEVAAGVHRQRRGIGRAGARRGAHQYQEELFHDGDREGKAQAAGRAAPFTQRLRRSCADRNRCDRFSDAAVGNFCVVGEESRRNAVHEMKWLRSP